MSWVILPGLCILWYIMHFIFKKKIRLLDVRMPGPRPLPVIGNVHQLDSQRLHLSLQELAQTYGSIYKIRMLNEHWVVLNSFDMIHDALVTKGNIVSGRPTSFRIKQMVKMGHFYLFDDVSVHSTTSKNLIARSLKTSGAIGKRLETVTVDMATDLAERWMAQAGGADNCKEDLFRFSAGLLLKTVVGEQVEIDSDITDILRKQERKLTEFTAPDPQGIALDVCPVLRWFGNKSWKIFLEGLACSRYIFEKYKPVNRANDHTTIDFLFGAMEDKARSITEDMIRGVLGTIFVAGTTTTSSTLYVIILVLSLYPNILANIQHEIDSVIGNNKPDTKYRKDMPYTEATILECIRNSSVTPLLLPHKVIEDTSLSGYHVPQGTNVFINAWAIHHDRDFWDEPFGYKPERFLDDDGLLLSPDHPRRRRVLAFGIGSRNCPGEMFAKTRMFLFTVAICQRFNVIAHSDDQQILASESRCKMDPREFDTNCFTLEPQKIKVQFSER